MTTARELSDAFDKAARALDRCPDCGARAILRYDPGVTFVFCLGCKETKLALPDWQPEEAVRLWND